MDLKFLTLNRESIIKMNKWDILYTKILEMQKEDMLGRATENLGIIDSIDNFEKRNISLIDYIDMLILVVERRLNAESIDPDLQIYGYAMSFKLSILEIIQKDAYNKLNNALLKNLSESGTKYATLLYYFQTNRSDLNLRGLGRSLLRYFLIQNEDGLILGDINKFNIITQNLAKKFGFCKTDVYIMNSSERYIYYWHKKNNYKNLYIIGSYLFRQPLNKTMLNILEWVPTRDEDDFFLRSFSTAYKEIKKKYESLINLKTISYYLKNKVERFKKKPIIFELESKMSIQKIEDTIKSKLVERGILTNNEEFKLSEEYLKNLKSLFEVFSDIYEINNDNNDKKIYYSFFLDKISLKSNKENEFQYYIDFFCIKSLEEIQLKEVVFDRIKFDLEQLINISLWELKKSNLKTAIAAIMSRNMSHNIGSHILSTLGYEGMSAADDRILFRYLHQRMDYIAQISTEMPKWTQSTWFLNDLMKRFYMQESLLKYLGHSERLKAYYYTKTGNKEAIEIKVKKKTGEKWGESEDVIPGSNPNDKVGNLEDFQLAIPGGVVGCHAFYTILENFIRNAAKHDWEKRTADNIENLEITIEFENNPDKTYIPIAVYYNIPLEEEKEKIIEDILNDSFKNCFIDDKGELIRKNWGLGEMRVSAGYLLKKDYGDIGFGGNHVLFKEKDNLFTGIIKADAIKKGGKKYLGYCFAVPKPKELLFIGKWNDLKKIGEEDAKKGGIWFHGYNHPERDYNFIIFEGTIFEQKVPRKKDGSPDELLIIMFLDQFPARIFVVWEENSRSELKRFIETKSPILIRRIVSLTKEAFKNLTKFNHDQENPYFEKLKIAIYKRWIDHLATQKRLENLKIHIDLEGRGTDTGDEKEKRIFNYLFDNYRKKIIEEIEYRSSSYANIGTYEVKKELKSILNELFNQQREKFKNRKALYSTFSDKLPVKISERKIAQFNNDESVKFQKGVNDYMESVFDSIFEIAEKLVYKDEEKIKTIPTVLIKRGSSNPDLKKISEEFNEFPPGIKGKIKIEAVNTEDEGDIIYKRHTPKYLGSIEKQYCEALSGSQNFYGILCGYLKEGRPEAQQILLQLIENALIHITIIDERIRDFYLKRFKNSTDKFKSAKINISKGIVYRKNDKIYIGIVEKAVGNGEEKAKIRNEQKGKIKDNGVYIIEDKPSTDASETEWGIKKLNEEEYLKIDILIIHQGIIDKMDFDNEKEREGFLDSIKKCIPFVIITSGRGDPMVPGTKFIPFSSIESFLMTDYPEKCLLVQSLMQIYKEIK